MRGFGPGKKEKQQQQQQRKKTTVVIKLFQCKVVGKVWIQSLRSLDLKPLPSISEPVAILGASQIAQLVMNLPAMQETVVQFLDREDPLEKG